MMSEYRGVIQKHLTKPWKDKTFYSFTLSGQDGIFNTGTRRPPDVGLTIAFEASPNEKGYLEVNGKTIKHITDGTPSQASVSTASKSTVPPKGGASNADGYWAQRLQRDIENDAARELGASRNTAISIIDLMLKYEAVPMPKTVAKRESFVWELLNKYTDKLMGKPDPEQTPEAEPASEAVIEDESWT